MEQSYTDEIKEMKAAIEDELGKEVRRISTFLSIIFGLKRKYIYV